MNKNIDFKYVVKHLRKQRLKNDIKACGLCLWGIIVMTGLFSKEIISAIIIDLIVAALFAMILFVRYLGYSKTPFDHSLRNPERKVYFGVLEHLPNHGSLDNYVVVKVDEQEFKIPRPFLEPQTLKEGNAVAIAILDADTGWQLAKNKCIANPVLICADKFPYIIVSN